MKLALALFALCILTAASIAQEHPAITALPIPFTSAPTANVNPHLTLLSSSSTYRRRKNSAQNAYQHASKASEQVRQVLRDNGIEPKAANIGFFSCSAHVRLEESQAKSHRLSRHYRRHAQAQKIFPRSALSLNNSPTPTSAKLRP